MRGTSVALVFALFVVSAYAAVTTFQFQPPLSNLQLVLGKSLTITVTARAAYPNVSVEISQNEFVTITPPVLNFTEGALSQQFTVTALAQQAYPYFTFTLDGDYAWAYFGVGFYINLYYRSVQFDGGYANYLNFDTPTVGISTSAFGLSLSDYPGNSVTVHVASDPAGAIEFPTAHFTFDTTIQSFPWSYTVMSIPADGMITLYFTYSGPDAQYYANRNDTIYPAHRVFTRTANSAPPRVLDTSGYVTFSTNYNPPDGVTLSLWSENIVFTPSALVFTADKGSAQFTYVASKVGLGQVVSYTVSGPNAEWYSTPQNGTIDIAARTFTVTQPTIQNYDVGAQSDLYTISTQYPPNPDVSLDLTVTAACPPGQSVSLSTPTLLFTPTQLSQSFYISSKAVCSNVVVTVAKSGTLADAYAAPTITRIISFGKIGLDVYSADPNFDLFGSTLYCGDSLDLTLVLQSPPPNGFTVTVTSTGGSLSNSVFEFSPSVITHSLTVTAAYSTTTVALYFAVTGPDSALVDQINAIGINSSPKRLTPPQGVLFNTPGKTSLFAGTVSDQEVVNVDVRPTTDVSLNIQATGITFNPSTVSFGPKDTQQRFTATGAASGSYTVTYSLGGTDSACYTLGLATTTVTVAKLSIAISPTFLQTVVVGVESIPYTLTIDNLTPGTTVTVTPVAQDQFGNVLQGIYTFNPATLVFTSAVPKVQFKYTVSAVRPTNDQIIFNTNNVAVTALVLNNGNVNLRTFTTPAILSTTGSGGTRPAYLVYDVPSPSYVVTVAQKPPTSVSLRPSAPNTVFNPAVLTFTDKIDAVSFTITTSQGSGAPGSNAGISTVITWLVEGTDAALYENPGTNSFYANLRSITVASVNPLTGSGVYFNTPITFTITTPYPPNNGLSILPYGSSYTITPSPDPIALAAGERSVIFTAKPTLVASDQLIHFTVSGADAAKYLPIADISVDVHKSTFSVNYPYFPDNVLPLPYGGDPFVFTIKADAPPAQSVTVNIYSGQVLVKPSSVQFTPTQLSFDIAISPIYASFSAPGVDTTFQLDYVLSGPDAANFVAPPPYQRLADISNPLRQLTSNPTVLTLPVGTTGTVVVSSAVPPINGVTITPYVPADNVYVFEPSSATLTATNTAVIFKVTRSTTTLSRSPSATVVFGLSGADAYLYSGSNGFTIQPQAPGISPGLNDQASFVVGQTYTTGISLDSPPLAGELVIEPYIVSGQPYTFTPTKITITGATVYFPYTIKPLGRGTSHIGFKVSGAAAGQYSYVDEVTVTNIPATITMQYTNYYAIIGESYDANTITLAVPPQTGLDITLSAHGFTFNPPTISFGPGEKTKTFTITAAAVNAASVLLAVLSGADAINYENPADYNDNRYIYSDVAGVSVSVGTSAVGKVTVTFSLSAGSPQPLTITPSSTPPGAPAKKRQIEAAGLTFVPSSVTFSDPSVTSLSITVYSSTPGQFNLYYSLSGPGTTSFVLATDQVASPVTLTFPSPSVNVATPPAVAPGILSQPITLTPVGPAPGVTVPALTITPWATVSGVEFVPTNITITSATPVTFQYRASSAGAFTINYVLSGPGADVFSPIPATSINVGFSNFILPSYSNNFMYPTGTATFVYGVASQWYTVYARSVPNNVTLTLQSTNDAVWFEPSVLTFSSKVHEATFRFTPKKVGVFQISYVVSGVDVNSFTLPAASNQLRATYKVSVGKVDTLSVGEQSNPISVSIEPTPADTFYLQIDTQTGVGLVYSPPILVFTPSTTTKTFTITPTSVNLPKVTAGNPHIPGVSGVGGASATYFAFSGREASDNAGAGTYVIPIVNQVGVVVAPGYFSLEHPRYQLDVETTIKVSISKLPRADVTLSFFSNNLHITPPYVTFRYGGDQTQEITVTPRQTTSYELDYAPFKVDYVLSGTNAADYITPSESLHYFAIPRGYIAAIVLVPLAVVVIILIAVVVLRKASSS